MAQYQDNNRPVNTTATREDGSGMGVIAGILIAVVLAIGAYFFFQNRAGNDTLEPAAGIEASAPDVDVDVNATPAPDAGTTPAPATTPAQ